MTNAQVAERKTLYRMIHALPDDDIEKAMSYVAFLQYLNQKEDEEDLAAYYERADEPTYSLEEIKAELGIE